MPTRFSRSSSSSEAAHRLVSSRCPECGAPVDFRSVPRDQAQVKCEYCGTLINIPGRTVVKETPPTSTPVATNIVVTSDGSLVEGGWGCGAVWWTIIVLMLVIGGLAIWSNTFFTTTVQTVTNVIESSITGESSESGASSDQPGIKPLTLPNLMLSPKLRLATGPIILRGSDNAATQMVMAAYQENGSLLIAFDPVKRVETWRSQLFSPKYYEMGVDGDATRLYVADGATLMALDRSNGKTLWQTSLANNIQTACSETAPCLQRVGEQVVTLARDGTVQGFAGSTGALLWSRHLNSQPRQFLVNNDQVLLIDNDTSNRAIVLVLNGGNGDLIHEFRPSCTFSNGIEIRSHSSDRFMIAPDGSALLVIGSGTYACVWRYNLSDGALVWNYRVPDVFNVMPHNWMSSSLALADPFVYFVKDDGDVAHIYVIDTLSQGAEPQSIFSINKYSLSVLYTVGDLLLVSAEPDYASEEVELWAIDRSTGERRWQRRLETTHSFDDWVTHPTDQGIFLAVCSWSEADCRFEVLDLATGASAGQTREPIRTPLSGAAWVGNRGYLTIDGKLYAFDLHTANIIYTWP